MNYMALSIATKFTEIIRDVKKRTTIVQMLKMFLFLEIIRKILSI